MGWSRHALGEGAALAVVLAASVRFFPRRSRRTDIEVSPTALGYLSGGTRRAVVTALAVLHVRGAVEVAKPGMVRRTDEQFGSGDRLLSATYAALDLPNGPRGIELRPQVQRAVAEVRKELVAAHLMAPAGRVVASKWLLFLVVPLVSAQIAVTHDATAITIAAIDFVVGGALTARDGRTRAGRALSRAAAEQPDESDPDSVGHAVARQGKRALRAIMPRFATDAGLLDGGIAAQFTGAGPNSDAMSETG
jgi:uncharacterized protein (TIGR04222 family)